MKQNHLIKLVLLFALFIGGCKKNEVVQPTFDAAVQKTTFKVGEQIPFTLAGNPDFVTFYSGEFGNDHAFADGRTLDIKSFSVAFQSRVTNGTQKNQLSIQISSDFNGKFDIASVKAATWKDITSSFTLATADYINSGEVDLNAIVTDRTKPLYIAFRYITQPQTPANGTQRNWAIRNFVLNTKTDIGTTTVIDQQSAAWSLVEDGLIIEPGRNVISASSGAITLRGNAGTTEAKNTYTEAWAISKGVDLSVINLGPDRSFPIKGISDPLPVVYNYAYTAPGIYKAVFTASNSTVYGQKAIIKELNITIQP
jgi:hypothetical protein